ncbi:MAG: hypothetical protein SOY04_09085 [Clostridium celatum]|nr:hypothetical protein [Clostridium celatum]
MGDNNTFDVLLTSASKLPMVHIDREKFLYKELIKFCSEDQVKIAIQHNPAYAGIDISIIEKIAKTCINYETNKVSAISFVAGIPGGLTMAGTVPADITQYFAHILRILQKLLYLYGWEEILKENCELDDETTNMLTIFIGVMFSVNGATALISKISASAAQKASKTLFGMTLTRGATYPIVKKIAQTLGLKMTKSIFAKGASKAIPIIGGIASGGLTYATYKPMAIKLKEYLKELKWCDPNYYANKTQF